MIMNTIITGVIVINNPSSSFKKHITSYLQRLNIYCIKPTVLYPTINAPIQYKMTAAYSVKKAPTTHMAIPNCM